MSAIVGAACFDSEPLDAKIPSQMLEMLAHRGPDASGVWCQEGVGLGQNALWTTPESRNEHQPLCDRESGLTLVSDARLDNRDELISALRPDVRPLSEITDAELIVAAYQRWGEECPARLLGDFAFALWDEDHRAIFCARDPFGVKGLYYHHQDPHFAFASEIKALFKVPWVPRELNEERVADHLVTVADDQRSTFYRDIHRLPAGHCMIVDDRGRRLHRYWALDPARELILGSDGEYEEAFRELLREAVRCRLRSAFPVGTMLSGGLDSSSITCIARDQQANDRDPILHTFSAVFPSLPQPYLRFVDERAEIQAIIARGNVLAHQVRADQLSPIGDLESILWHQDDPLVPFNAYMHLGLYRAARAQGVRVVLDGFDGDTTVSHGYERLPELAKTFRWIALLRESRAVVRVSPSRQASLRRILWAYALSPLMPAGLSSLWKSSRKGYWLPWGSRSLIAEPFAKRVGLDDRIRRREGDRVHRFRNAREAHRRSLESSLVPYSLELADKTAAACLVEARYPFFDRRLVEFCLALAPDQKLRDGWDRSVMRRAMHGILPPEVQWRKTKANLSPNFYRNLSTLGRAALERILDEDLDAVSGYIDADALKATCSRFIKNPSNRDAMTLFLAAAFTVWIRRDIADR